MDYGFIHIVILEQHAQIVMGIRIVRIDLQRLLELSNRFIRSAIS